jgi:hypothetical protein
MPKDNRDLLDVLKFDLGFLEKGWAWLAVFALLCALTGYTGWAKDSAGPVTQAAPTSEPRSGPPSSYAVRPMNEASTGTISGQILYSGKPVLPKRFAVTSDTAVCGTTKEVYPVRIEQGGIADAVTWIDDISSGKPFDFPSPLIDQKKCAFVPHVLLMKPGELKLGNTDLCLHNIHVSSYANREVNKAIPPGAAPQEITLARADLVRVRCDVHKWMGSYVIVAKNPYYVVTGAGGKFHLEGVPAGHYHLKVWQESLGELDQEIIVEAAKTTEVTFTYKANAM